MKLVKMYCQLPPGPTLISTLFSYSNDELLYPFSLGPGAVATLTECDRPGITISARANPTGFIKTNIDAFLDGQTVKSEPLYMTS